MRNLVLVAQQVQRSTVAVKPQALTVDVVSDAVWAVLDGNILVSWCDLSVDRIVDLGKEASLPTSAVCKGLEHVCEARTVCMAFTSGDLLVYHTEENVVEAVGCVDGGLVAMAWSPDRELLVLLTGNGNLILMTKEFDVVTEQPVKADSFGQQPFVDVGWGKKETQFHGTAAKARAMEQGAEPDSIATSLADDGQPRVAWRGDGKYFVVGAVDAPGAPRRLRVYSREGHLQTTSEMLTGLEQALDWKPSGQLIVSSERAPHRHDIVFFERNGLRHGEFTLPCARDEFCVQGVQWNCSSTVLAVWLSGLSEASPASRLQLWTTNNYHWYLKQEYKYDGPEGALACMAWHPEKPDWLVIATTNGWLCHYQYGWDVCTSDCGTGAGHAAEVAVIDGSQLLITPFSHAVVPPPMALNTVQLPAPAQCVAIGQLTAALLPGPALSLYRHTDFHAPPVQVAERLAIGPISTIDCVELRHLHWLGSDTLLGVAWDVDQCCDSIFQIDIIQSAEGAVSLANQGCVSVGFTVLNLAPSTKGAYACIQLADGSLRRVTCGLSGQPPSLANWGPMPCSPGCCESMALVAHDGEDIVLTHSPRGGLQANGIQIAKDSTAFVVHTDYVVYLATDSMAYCLPIADVAKVARRTADVAQLRPQGRRVERGSAIVTAVESDTSLVLQMPRGNLETVHLRPLVVSALRKDIAKGEWSGAFYRARKHRLNMNMLYDVDPGRWEANVEPFLLALASPKNINLFLSDLRDVDVAKELNGQGSSVECEAPGKVERVCDMVREKLLALDTAQPGQGLGLSVVMCLAKKGGDAALEQALCYAKARSSTTLNADTDGADNALTFLCFLANEERLYKVALGMYDLNLALRLAEMSQMDPREYKPYLNGLANMPAAVMEYTVNRDLGRHAKALASLSKAGADHMEECMAFLVDKELYREALTVFADQPEAIQRIQALYGEHLLAAKQFEEASLLFEACGQLERALTASQHGGDWIQAFALAHQLSYDQRQLADLANEVGGALQARGCWAEAATVYQEYLNDTEEAVACLVQGQHWGEALRVLHRAGRKDLLVTTFVPGLENAWQTISQSIESTASTFSKRLERLQTVRLAKAEAAMYGLDVDGPVDIDDASSDVFSLASRSSRRSKSSSRSKKKMQKKRLSLREGGPFEELALMDALGVATLSITAEEKSVQSLLPMLVRFNKQDMAQTLQQQYQEALQCVQRAHQTIWPITKAPASADPAMENHDTTEISAAPPPVLQATSTKLGLHQLTRASQESLLK